MFFRFHFLNRTLFAQVAILTFLRSARRHKSIRKQIRKYVVRMRRTKCVFVVVWLNHRCHAMSARVSVTGGKSKYYSQYSVLLVVKRFSTWLGSINVSSFPPMATTGLAQGERKTIGGAATGRLVSQHPPSDRSGRMKRGGGNGAQSERVWKRSTLALCSATPRSVRSLPPCSACAYVLPSLDTPACFHLRTAKHQDKHHFRPLQTRHVWSSNINTRTV